MAEQLPVSFLYLQDPGTYPSISALCRQTFPAGMGSHRLRLLLYEPYQKSIFNTTMGDGRAPIPSGRAFMISLTE